MLLLIKFDSLMEDGGPMTHTIALAQINTHLGNVRANLDQHITLIHEAASAGADLIVFPELSLTGYVLQDLTPTVAHQPVKDDPIFSRLLDASQKIDLAVGFVDEDKRHRFYIAAAYLSKGEVIHVHHKLYLPTYGLFDEGRFFAKGESISGFDTRFGRLGILICEDFWHISSPYLQWLDGTDIFIFMSASPGRGLRDEPQLESANWVEHLNQSYASLFTAFIVYVNRVGYEDGFNFWGGSTVFGPNGEFLGKSPYHQESLTLVEIDQKQLVRTRTRLPLLRDERTSLVQRELGRILQFERQ